MAIQAVSQVAGFISQTMGVSPWVLGATVIAGIALPLIARSFTPKRPKKIKSLVPDRHLETWFYRNTTIKLYKKDSSHIKIKIFNPAHSKNYHSKLIKTNNHSLYFAGWEGNAPLLSQNGKTIHSWHWKGCTVRHVQVDGKDFWVREAKRKILSWVKKESYNLDPCSWEDPLGFPKFINNSPPTWTQGARKVSVLLLKERATWKVEDSCHKNTKYIPVEKSLYAHLPEEAKVWRLMAQTLTSFHKFAPAQLKTFKCFISRPDPTIVVDEKMWTVTLIDTGDYEGYRCIGGHAMILIEGIEENLPLVSSADLTINKKTLKGKIHLKDYPLHTYPSIVSKSKTELRKSDVVRKWMSAIRKEKQTEREFNFLGKGSMYLVEGHNCMSWAREKLLALDIEIGPGVFFFDAVKLHTTSVS